MLLTTLLVATMTSTPSLPVASHDAGVNLISAYEEVVKSQHATTEFAQRLSPEASVTPEGGLFALARSVSPSSHGPFDGAAMSQEGRAILALVLGLVVGFGIGHLVAQDTTGFVLFLIIDIVLIAASAILPSVFWPIWWVPSLLLLVSHIYQGIDAYGKASGTPLIRRSIESTIRVAGVQNQQLAPPMTPRAFSFSF